MKKIGIISYNLYGNFTNYGSMLQSWALYTVCNRFDFCNTVLADYIPEHLKDKNPLNPLKHMWDQDDESQQMCEASLPAIKDNYIKFSHFFQSEFKKTRNLSKSNFDVIAKEEHLDGFICGSDTIFCIDESKGFDDGFFANFNCMRNNSIAYAASIGDSVFTNENETLLINRIQNFKAIGLREKSIIHLCRRNSTIPVQKTIDPTLLLSSHDYDSLAAGPQLSEKYLLLYARRYNAAMEKYAERIAQEKGLKIVEISLRAKNACKGHIMRYDAGIEEFLSLVKHADFLVTNSFHGLIFGVQYKRPLVVFSREQAGNKIQELLDVLGMSSSLFIRGNENFVAPDYEIVHKKISEARKKSLAFLEESLRLLCT